MHKQWGRDRGSEIQRAGWVVLNTNSGVGGVGSSEYKQRGSEYSDTDAIKAFVTHRERYSGQDPLWNGFPVCNSQRALFWNGFPVYNSQRALFWNGFPVCNSQRALFWNGFPVCKSQRALLWPGPALEWFPRL